MTKTAATVHNPTHFEPKDYEVFDYLDNKRPVYIGEGAEAFADHVAWWEKDMELALGANWRAKIHHCVHCGNRVGPLDYSSDAHPDWRARGVWRRVHRAPWLCQQVCV